MSNSNRISILVHTKQLVPPKLPAIEVGSQLTPDSRTSAAAAAAPGALRALRADANDLSPGGLGQITQGCLEYLGRPAATREGGHYVAYLVTATLCLGMAPRQQVLRQLQLGSSFLKKADGQYWIVMLAHMNKNGKATTFPIAQELTKAYDVYLESVRPQLLGGKSHDYVFCKRTGDAPGATFDFSDWTRSVTKVLIGRPVNCHAFRSAVVTTYYKSGASQCQMNALADVMAHDPKTARDYYYRDDAQKQAAEIQERMREAYGLSVALATHNNTSQQQNDSAAAAAYGFEPMCKSVNSISVVNPEADHNAETAKVPALTMPLPPSSAEDVAVAAALATAIGPSAS